jgi:hypothetical protein
VRPITLLNINNQKGYQVNKKIKEYYYKFKAAGMGHIVGEYAKCALYNARTLYQFEQFEHKGLCKMVLGYEQEDYFSVYGEPDTEAERKAIVDVIERLGLYYIAVEVWNPSAGVGWDQVDSIGMCIYNNPLDPFENDYVISLMAAAIERIEGGLIHAA